MVTDGWRSGLAGVDSVRLNTDSSNGYPRVSSVSQSVPGLTTLRPLTASGYPGMNLLESSDSVRLHTDSYNGYLRVSPPRADDHEWLISNSLRFSRARNELA